MGPYPQRPPALQRPALRAGAAPAAVGDIVAVRRGLARVRRAQAAWLALPSAAFAHRLKALRAHLARDGYGPGRLRCEALGCVAAVAQRSLQREPYDTQLWCAQVLLDGALAEMATGEGKTLAVALAAAVGALAGAPVHVMTANDYLAERDARTLQPLFAALGLQCSAALSSHGLEQRAQAYAADVAYTTARQLAFDHLRDGLSGAAEGGALAWHAAALAGEPWPRPLLRGLCMALVDEADSLMIDEATMPLLLAESQPDPAHRAACFQALALARQLSPGVDAWIDRDSWSVRWSPAGEANLAVLAERLGARWRHRQQRLELCGSALVALHLLQADRHYLVRDGRIELLDAVTGRAAPGRVWQQGLQTLVELKEGCAVTPPARTTAQTTYPQFFGRYWHLAGTSGTLAECRTELSQAYGLAVVAIARRAPDRHISEPARVFASGAQRRKALVPRLQALQRVGRPVLVGCDSVAAAQALSQDLQCAGLVHTVLDARHDADEADRVARAGRAGAITVATAMAGRGTDIALGPGVAQLGGLHVIVCQDNRSARLDRQFTGRAGRQGEPGSSEIWLALDAPAWADTGPLQWLGQLVPTAEGQWPHTHWCTRLATRLARQQQRIDQRRGMRQRRHLLHKDLTWQSRLSFNRQRG